MREVVWPGVDGGQRDEVPGALSQGRTRLEARENVLDALRIVLTPDDELAGRRSAKDLEHLRYVAAA